MSNPGWRDDAPPTSAGRAGGGLIAIAIRLADRYPHRIPTIEELEEVHGMSKATAYRWRDHFKAARATTDEG